MRSCNATVLYLPRLTAPSTPLLSAPKRLGLDASLYQILQILSVSLFEKTPILCALQAIGGDANFAENANQLILFDF